MRCNATYRTWNSSQQLPVQTRSPKCEQQITHHDDLLFFSFTSTVHSPSHHLIHSQGPFPHALPKDLCVLGVKSHYKPCHLFLFLPFPTPPTLDVHSQEYPCVFVDHIGQTDGWDDFQQVRGDSSIKSGHTLLGHDVVEQDQHGGFRGSLHWNWWGRKTSYYRCHKSLRMDIFDLVTLSCGNIVYNNLS